MQINQHMRCSHRMHVNFIIMLAHFTPARWINSKTNYSPNSLRPSWLPNKALFIHELSIM